MLKLNAGNRIVAIKRLVPVSDIGGQGGDWDLWPDSQNTFVLKHFKITEPTIFPGQQSCVLVRIFLIYKM